jgi:hypothetical protein
MSIKLEEGKVKSHPRGNHAADQPTQTDKPPGPFVKSSAASPMKKDGGV